MKDKKENPGACGASCECVEEKMEALEGKVETQPRPGRVQEPSYAVHEAEGEWRVEVALPGVDKKEIDLEIEADTLVLSASRSDVVPEGWKRLRHELQEGDYRLALRLAPDIDRERIDARMEDGVLTLTLPEVVKPGPSRIEVS